MSNQSSSPGTSSSITVWVTSLVVIIFVGIYINSSFFLDRKPWGKFVGVLCVIIYGIIFLTNMLYQSSLCPNDSRDWGKIAIGATPSIGIVAIGSFLVLYFSKLRIPVASILKSYVLERPSVIEARRQSGKKQNECCDDKMDLATLEGLWAPLKGASYLYYLFFMVAMSVIIGQSKSTVTCLPRK
jgi:hypothetical protein